MTRDKLSQYTDVDILALYAKHGTQRIMAEAVGVSEGHVGVRVRSARAALGVPADVRPRSRPESETTAEQLSRIEDKIDVLLSRPAQITEWRPDHTRVKDGGRNVTKQRRDVGLPRRQP